MRYFVPGPGRQAVLINRPYKTTIRDALLQTGKSKGGATLLIIKYFKMKNIIKKSFVLVVFMLGLTFINNANVQAEEQCHTVQIFCGNGTSNFGLICGETYQEYLQNLDEMTGVVCDTEQEAP